MIDTKTKDGVIIENTTVTMTIKDGRITVLPPGSLADSFSRRELIPRGASAGFVIYEDHPNDWDAWSVHCHQVGQSLTLT